MDSLPYRGVEVIRPTFGSAGFYHWRCGRCLRQGRDQTRTRAEAGKERHEAYHRAQDALAAKRAEADHLGRLFRGEGD